MIKRCIRILGSLVCLRFCFTLLLACFCLVASADAEQRRKCAAFVVGVESYDKRGLDNLSYVAEDAYAVWQRLKTLTDLDESLSRLMVADRKATNRPLPAAASEQGQKQLFDQLPSRDIRDEFQAFLSRLDDDSPKLVIVYVGGHGIINESAPSLGVYFTASNYRRIPQGAIRVRALIDDMRSVFGNRPDVDLVFFANMCHAGALAPGEARDPAPDADRYKTASESDSQEVRNLNLAYFPACGADVSAFERANLRSSEFAHHLLEGLAGARASGDGSANRRITSGKLMDYLREKISSIPKLPGFRNNIAFGNVLHHEAEMRQLLGEGLMTVALDTDGNERDSLLRLAEWQFERAQGQHFDKRFLFDCKLARWQCRRLRSAETADLDTDLLDFARGNSELVELDILSVADEQQRPFVAFVFQNEVTSSKRGEFWKAHLESSEFSRGVTLLSVGHEPVLRAGSSTLHAIRSAKENAEEELDLILVYTGDVDVYHDPVVEQVVTFPIAADDVWNVAREWGGRVALTWEASEGSSFLSIPEDLRDRVVVKTVRETEARPRLPMTDPQVMFISRALRRLLKEHAIPNRSWGMALAVEDSITSDWQRQSDGLSRTPPSWPDQITQLESLRPRREFDHLRLAGLYEAIGRDDKAREHIDQFLVSSKDWKPEATIDNDLGRVRAKASARLSEMREQLSTRQVSGQGKIHFVVSPVSEYEDPSIGDLPGTIGDADRWVHKLTEVYGERLVVHRLDNRKSMEVVEALRAACESCQSNDAVVFWFSGRGFHATNDGRCLIYPDFFLGVGRSVCPGGFGDPEWGGIRLSYLTNLLSKAKGRTFAILDCQFSLVDGQDSYQPFQKNLVSLWPPQTIHRCVHILPSIRSVSSSRATEGLYSIEEPLPGTVVMWWDGILHDKGLQNEFGAENQAERLARPASTVFSEQLLRAFPMDGLGHCRDWLERASAVVAQQNRQRLSEQTPSPYDYSAPELEETDGAGVSVELLSGRIMTQGDLDVPLFRGRSDSPTISELINEVPLRRANLDGAIDLVDEAKPLFDKPEDRLVQISLLLRDARFHSTLKTRESAARAAAIRRRAFDLLDKLSDIDPRQMHADGLLHVYVRSVTELMESSDRFVDGAEFLVDVYERGGGTWFDRELQTRFAALLQRAFQQDRIKMMERFEARLPAVAWPRELWGLYESPLDVAHPIRTEIEESSILIEPPPPPAPTPDAAVN